MDLSIVSQFMSLTPDMMYKATKMVEAVQSYFPGDVDSQEQYLNENLIDQTLEYALTLLEDKKVRDYMGTTVYTNGTTFSAPTLALYNVASMPEMKQRIQAKLNAKGGVRKEEVEVIDEKKRPKLKGRKFNGKNPWWNSDGDDTPYEPGDDVKKTRKEAVDHVAELWRNRHSDDQLDEVKGYGGHVDPHTGQSTGKRSSSQQAHATHWDNRRRGKDVPDPRRSKFKYGGSTGSTTGAHQGEPPEHFAKKQNPDLAMTPANRMKSRATALRARGEGKRANKIDAVRNRPNMGEEFANEEYELNEMPYQIYGPDKHGPSDGEPVKLGKPYKNKKRARSRADRLDQEIGGYRHSVRYTPEEFAIEAKNKEGKEQGLDGKACWKGYKKAGTKMKGGRVVDNCVKMEDVAEIATEYFLSEGLNEYGIDILIDEMGLDDFCDFVNDISDEYMLSEARTLVGKKKTAATGKARGVSLKAAPGKTTKAAVEKYGTTRKLSGSSSSGTIKTAANKQPETKSTPTQTKEKAKGGILGALKARAEKDIASVRQSVNTARQVGARRAAEVKATYDAVRAKGKEAEQSAGATRARRKATVATGRAAQAAGRTAIKAAGAAGAAAGEAVKARKSGKSAAATAGRAVGTFLRKMKKEEKELLTRYFIESEIAFNYDEVQEIFETLDQEHFDYFMDQATLMVEESGPSARELIEEKLQNNFNLERFTFADWRHLTEKKTSDDTATSKFVSLTQSNRTDNTPDVKGKRKDGVIINPQIDMRSEEVEEIDERRRVDKGKPRGPEPSDVFKAVSAAMGSSRLGVQPRGKKKVPGKKPPVAGQYGGPESPAQKVANRRAAAKRAQDNMSSRFD